jgi:hypothetical protein
MDGGSSEESEAQFAAYVEALSVVLGGVDRQQPMDDYCLELLMPIERKSVEPMAAVTRPAQVEPALAKAGGRAGAPGDRARRCPPQDQVSPRSSRDLPFLAVTDPEAPPIRPERHILNDVIGEDGAANQPRHGQRGISVKLSRGGKRVSSHVNRPANLSGTLIECIWRRRLSRHIGACDIRLSLCFL